MAGRRASEAGTSLVEVLVALAILSVAGVAILAGLQLSITTSDIQRKQTSGGAYVRNYAEAIEASVATGGTYSPGCSTAAYAPGVVGYAPPSGFTASVADVEALTGVGAAAAGCPDTGVQRLTVQVASADDRARESLTLVVRDPGTEETP